MRVPFGLSSYQRGPGDLPELPVINLYAEEAPTEEGQVVLQSRPGLSDRSADMGAGPVKALFRRNGVLSGELFGVSAGAIYRATTSLGTITGSGPVSIAGSEIGIVATAGATARYYNGSALADISFPDSANVRKVFSGESRFWLIRDESGKLYFTPPLAATVAALDFVTAEDAPDNLLDGLWIDDGAVLGGVETIEFWQSTGDDDLPITPVQGLVIHEGVKATGCLVEIGETFAVVTNKNKVRLGKQWTTISNPGLQKRIEDSSSVSLFTFQIDGAEFLGLRLDTEVQGYNLGTGLWSEFASYDKTNWLPQCHADGVFGSSEDGKTFEWSDAYEDLGGQLERRFRAGFWGAIGTIIANLFLQCQVGQTPYLTGDYVTPTVEMRVSLDNGRTWGNWRSASLGSQGEYWVTPVWRALGMLKRWKGFLVEFRVTAPVDWRVSDVRVNEPVGGR